MTKVPISLLEDNPALASEWHPVKNSPLMPHEVTSRSNRKVWWSAACGHEWESSIYNRAGNGAGCPICSNQRVLVGFNDLESQFPEIAAQWDFARNHTVPNCVTKKSTKKAFWVCDKGHSWEAQISSRTMQGTNCPYCAGNKILSGFNDLETLAPPYLADWHPKKNLPLLPSEIGPATATKVWWLCSRGHEYLSALNGRARGQGCPICSSKQLLAGFNDFASAYPHLVKYWDSEKNGTDPSSVPRSAPKRLYWFRCNLGHEFRASTNQMSRLTDGHSGCPVCAGKTLLVGFNDLATRLPEVCELWNHDKNLPLTPRDVTRASTRKVWWSCKIDKRHEWLASVASRSKGQGCPICTSRYVVAGLNDLATVAPSVAADWDLGRNGNLRPSDVSSTTPKKVWWRCQFDSRHEWQASVETRAIRGLGCPVCSNHKTITGVNDLQTTHPHIAAEWDQEKNDFKAFEVNAGNQKSFWWKCRDCHSSWRASSSNRTRVKSGCPNCAKTGYDPTSQGYLYLLRRQDDMLQQFGITNRPSSRLAKHRRNGWEVVDVLGPLDGYFIVDLESSLKRYFSDKGLLLNRTSLEKFDGYTESWFSETVSFDSLSSLLEELRNWEWNNN